MLIRYTTEIFYAKPEAKYVGWHLKNSAWREAHGDFGVLVNLYRMGHGVHISDREESDCLILDLDGDEGGGMSEDILEKIHSPSFIGEVVCVMEAEDAVLLQSASRNPGKAKLFIRKPHARQIEGNTDLAYRAERIRFEEAFGVPCDFHMDSWTQITWGCRDPEASYSEDTLRAMNESKASEQPRAGTSSRTHSRHRQVPDAETGISGRFIPLNQWVINAAVRREARPDIYRVDFYPYFHTKNGRESLVIPVGKRESTDIRIIIAAVYHAWYLNGRYGTEFVEADAEATVLAVIQRHFEDGAAYISENGNALRRKIADEWERCGKDVQEYGRSVCIACNGEAKMGYTPRDTLPGALWNAYGDEILASVDPDSLIAWASEGDVATIKALKRRLRNARRPAGEKRGRGRPRNDYAEVVASADKDEGGRLILPIVLRSPAFRRYLSEHSIKGPFKWT